WKESDVRGDDCEVHEKIYIKSCPCNSAAKQLLQRGLFPYAPLHPTLAVDIQVLEHVGQLFLQITPNQTAWCDTITNFLQSMGYNMNPLRRRFTNSFNWFSRLKKLTEAGMDGFVEKVWEMMKSEVAEDGDEPPTTPDQEAKEMDHTQYIFKRGRLNAPKLSWPSKYLRAQCPPCFGGAYSGVLNGLDFDAIFCVDACFTQKHNKGSRNPPKQHPDMSFLLEQELEEMEAYVESIQPSKPKTSTRTKLPLTEDYRIPFMKVPNSALADCKESFTATDDRRQKSSTQFFDCTGVMGLLC
ncbi:hypothetical protein V5O48_010561, partial [Marasmius crinis-equi]